MEDKETVLKPIPTKSTRDSVRDAEKYFAFDYSYWSFDGFKVEPDGYFSPVDDSNYCDQKRIFSDLGMAILLNSFLGYNASLFAYGQTGSGKSYSIYGKGPNKVPQVCDKLFQLIDEKSKTNKEDQYEVTFSMFEIYNEIARDLLTSKMDRKGLQIHERPGKGFHILEKDLKPIQVCNYATIQKLIERGNANKTIAETRMNATSSRSHTIVELKFKQTFRNKAGSLMQRMSTINLVDLAGSERAHTAQTTGDRFKESIAINLSLTCLGTCIAALSSKNRDASIRIPYRESILTKLLMNALGGNSKTIMLATISPSESSYGLTLSTLRYADRAKQIKCNAKVNEDPKDKLILELQNEIIQLKNMIRSDTMIKSEFSDLSQKDFLENRKEIEEALKKQIEQNELEIEALKLSYEQKLAEALAKSKEINKNDTIEKAKTCAHFSNINPDPMLTGTLKYLIELNETKRKLIIGSDESADIQIIGIGINDKHCSIKMKHNDYLLTPFPNSKVIINGKQINERTHLKNFDRVVLGASMYYLFVDPHKFKVNELETINEKINNFKVEKVQEEIAQALGILPDMKSEDKSPNEIACINELIDIMPSVEEANGMSIVLDKKMKYEPIILNPIVLGEPNSPSRVLFNKPVIIVRKFGTHSKWLWDLEKFIERKSLMSEMYLCFKENDEMALQNIKHDPFIELETEPVLIGTSLVEPRCILHRVPLNEKTKIYDYLSKLIGQLDIELIPCDKQGIALEDITNSIVQEPEKQLRELYFLLRINRVKIMSARYKPTYCQYKLYGYDNYVQNEINFDKNNQGILYQKLISYEKVDQDLVNYYSNQPLLIQIYGIQLALSDKSSNYTTLEWFDQEKADKSKLTIDEMRDELNRIQLDLDKSKSKLQNIGELLQFVEQNNKKRIRVEYVKESLQSDDPDTLIKLKNLIEKDNAEK